MAEKHVERRSAAILVADVAGYSGHMEADEVGTLRALQSHRGELIEAAVSEHRGQIVKTRGTDCSSSSRASSMPLHAP